MLALLALAVLPQTTWYVERDAAPPGNGTLAAPYTRVDYAAAQPGTLEGDTLVVAPGVYPGERIQLGVKGLRITGVGDAGSVVLEGSFSGSILTADAAISPVTLTNLSFRGGRGESSANHGGAPVGALLGGAIRVTDTEITVQACFFEDCTAEFGGAIAFESSDGDLGGLTIQSTLFEESCVAAIDGGAVHNTSSTLMVSDSTVRGSALAGRGGAVFYRSAPPAPVRDMSFVDCIVEGNAFGDGGAIYTERSHPGIRRCTVHGRCLGNGRGGGFYSLATTFTNILDSSFAGGRALWGGGIYGSNLRVEKCYFTDNETWAPLGTEPGGGGAVCALDTAIVERAIFDGNRATHNARSVGGAIYGPAVVENSTFVDNDASLDGAAFFSQPNFLGLTHLRRCIVQRSEGSTTQLLNSGTVARSNIIEGGFPAYPSNIDADPLFWGASDFHLLPGSPARAVVASGVDKGAFPFDPFWCGEGCTGPIGLVSCVAMPSSFGVPAQISALGSTDVSVDRVVLVLSEMPSQAPALVIASQLPDFVPNAGGSAGTLCIGGSILRFPTGALTYKGQTISYRPTLSDFPLGVTVQAGQSWFFQFWFRDTGPSGPTSNFSPAMYVPFQ